MSANINRGELIDFLLRRRFGSLAPPPAPTVNDPRMAEAGRRRALAIAGKPYKPLEPSAFELERNKLNALGTPDLQRLVDEAKAEDAAKAQHQAANTRAMRESSWPHWAKKDLWSEAEFAAFCVGLIPDERGMRPDPGKNEVSAVAINRANDDIRRGTLSGSLQFVPRSDSDAAARMYGTARHYIPAVASEWAATRFDSFPTALLALVRARAASSPPTKTAGWPWGEHETELLRHMAAAVEKFWVRYDPADATTAPRNEDVAAWLRQQGVAGRTAQVIATILRADGLPTGPRT